MGFIIKKMSKNNFIIFCFTLLCTTMTISAAPLTYTLDNLCKVAIVPDAASPIVTVRTYVRVGSVFESGHMGSGISHYVEHLVAGGSTTLQTEEDYKQTISLLGGVSNAYTTFDHTSYFINTSPEHLETALTVLYEWMFFSAFADAEVRREQAVITREIEKTTL